MTNDEAACRTLIAGTFFKTKVVIMKHFHILTAPICPSQLVNLRDTGGATPLHLAAATNRYKRKNFFYFYICATTRCPKLISYYSSCSIWHFSFKFGARKSRVHIYLIHRLNLSHSTAAATALIELGADLNAKVRWHHHNARNSLLYLSSLTLPSAGSRWCHTAASGCLGKRLWAVC